MTLIARWNEKEVHYLALTPSYLLIPPFPDELYVCTLIVHDPNIAPEEQASLSTQLVQSGCRYAVCAGHRCSSWDDSIDWAYLSAQPDFRPSDENFVMTTWHESDPLEDILSFALNSTDFPPHFFSKSLILSLGSAESFGQQLESAISAVWSKGTLI